jgi:hypothetical protein
MLLLLLLLLWLDALPCLLQQRLLRGRPQAACVTGPAGAAADCCHAAAAAVMADRP